LNLRIKFNLNVRSIEHVDSLVIKKREFAAHNFRICIVMHTTYEPKEHTLAHPSFVRHVTALAAKAGAGASTCHKT